MAFFTSHHFFLFSVSSPAHLLSYFPSFFMSTTANVPCEDEPEDLMNEDDNKVDPSQVSEKHPSLPFSMGAPSSDWTLAMPSSVSQP
jgi:hypothetical protein